MTSPVVLRQGDPLIVLREREKPLILERNTINNTYVTNRTEVTQVIEPEDPGDLILLFDNQLI